MSCEFFCMDKSIFLINKDYILMHRRQDHFPISPGKCATSHIANKFNSTGHAEILVLVYHLDKSCFSCGTIALYYSDAKRDEKYTFYELKQKSNQFGNVLKKLGIEGSYEGIGNLILGYAAAPAVEPAPRKANYVYNV